MTDNLIIHPDFGHDFIQQELQLAFQPKQADLQNLTNTVSSFIKFQVDRFSTECGKSAYPKITTDQIDCGAVKLKSTLEKQLIGKESDLYHNIQVDRIFKDDMFTFPDLDGVFGFYGYLLTLENHLDFFSTDNIQKKTDKDFKLLLAKIKESRLELSKLYSKAKQPSKQSDTYKFLGNQTLELICKIKQEFQELLDYIITSRWLESLSFRLARLENYNDIYNFNYKIANDNLYIIGNAIQGLIDNFNSIRTSFQKPLKSTTVWEYLKINYDRDFRIQYRCTTNERYFEPSDFIGAGSDLF